MSGLEKSKKDVKYLLIFLQKPSAAFKKSDFQNDKNDRKTCNRRITVLQVISGMYRKFIPYQPVKRVSGMKIVVTMVRSCMILF